MKLHKLLIAVLIFFAGSVFANENPVIKPYTGSLEVPQFVTDALNSNNVILPAPFLAANWTEFDFGAGDTTTTYDVQHASAIYLIYRDTSMTGTDTLWIGITNTLSNGLVLDAAVKVQAMNQTTSTTFLSGAALIPGDNTTTAYIITPVVYNTTKLTATIKIARLNRNDNVTPYLPTGRGLLAAE